MVFLLEKLAAQQRADPAAEDGDVARLADEVIGPGGEGLAEFDLGFVAGEHQHGDGGKVAAAHFLNASADFKAIHFRHDEIDEHAVVFIGADLGEAVGPAFAGLEDIALGLEFGAQVGEVGRAIVDGEDAAPGEGLLTWGGNEVVISSGAVEECGNPQEQNFAVGSLGQKPVGSAVEAADFGALALLRGEHEDRHAACGDIALDPAAQFVAPHSRQEEIEEDHVGKLAVERFESRGGIGSDLDGVSRVFEFKLELEGLGG